MIYAERQTRRTDDEKEVLRERERERERRNDIRGIRTEEAKKEMERISEPTDERRREGGELREDDRGNQNEEYA